MTIQDNLKEFAPYNIDFKINNEWFVVGVEFNKSWQIIMPQNKQIEHVEKSDRHYYCAPLSDVNFDEVFNCIRDTISYNKDMEKKVELFQQKIKELQELFSILEYDELCTIEFKTKKKKRKIKNSVIKNEEINKETTVKEMVNSDEDDKIITDVNQEENNIEDFVNDK